MSRLTDRDQQLLTLLDQHRTLTTGQIAAMLFGSVITCRHRLAVLHRLGLVDFFTRHRPGYGSHPYCWVLGPVGLRYAALVRGERPPTPKTVREYCDRLAVSPTLTHLLGVNQFFVDLNAHARAEPAARLVRWWSEQVTTEAYGRRIQPDGHGLWSQGDATVGFFLEFDTGTEVVERVAAKVAAYDRLHHAGGPAYPVLFWLPGRQREDHLHQRLRGLRPRVPVATATHDSTTAGGPAGAVWRLHGNGRPRHRLVDLPSHPGEPGPLNPPPDLDRSDRGPYACDD